MHEKLHVQCEVLFGQNPAEGSTGPSQIKRVLRTMWKLTPRNTAHMRQHAKFEYLKSKNQCFRLFFIEIQIFENLIFHNYFHHLNKPTFKFSAEYIFFPSALSIPFARPTVVPSFIRILFISIS